MDRHEKVVNDIFDEAKRLYNLTEQDVICLNQLLFMVKALGFSPSLTVRLLRPLVFMMEVIVESAERDAKS